MNQEIKKEVVHKINEQTSSPYRIDSVWIILIVSVLIILFKFVVKPIVIKK